MGWERQERDQGDGEKQIVWKSCAVTMLYAKEYKKLCDRFVCERVVCEGVACGRVVCERVMCGKAVRERVVCDRVASERVVCDTVVSHYIVSLSATLATQKAQEPAVSATPTIQSCMWQDCVWKRCVEELCVKEEGRGGDGARRMADGIPNKKQEPHLKMWEKKLVQLIVDFHAPKCGICGMAL